MIYNNYEKVKIVSKCLQTKKINDDDLIKLKIYYKLIDYKL